MTKILYGGKQGMADAWRDALLALKPDLDLTMSPDDCAPEDVDIILYEPSGTIQNMRDYSNIAAIQSLWAGVETLIESEALPIGPPLLRMVEDGLTHGMTDYVVGHAYRAHLGVVQQQADQAKGVWGSVNPPLARDRKVGIIGLGALGRDAAEKLRELRFDVSGWSRTAKEIDGVQCLCGPGGLQKLLAESEILVLLAPHTPETENLLDAAAFASMPRGAHLINAARGALIDEDALLAALNAGQIATAVLDVMRSEPLPAGHPFWQHPQVLITPHIASVTRPETAAATIIEQVERFETGRPFLHTVQRERGY